MKFDFLSPTFVRFGSGVLETTGQETCKIGRKVLLVTGKSSSKKSGSLKRVEKLLKRENLEIVLFDQVEQNPSVETVEVGAGVAREAGCFCGKRISCRLRNARKRSQGRTEA